MNKRANCPCCGDRPGEIGQHYPDDVPLGELKRCDACGRWACPVCLDRLDCCEQEEAA